MENLRTLHLLHIQIVEGKWQGVVERVKRSMKLRDFSVDNGWSTIHGIDIRIVVQYVLRGGRHQGLRSEEPESASEKSL